MNFYFLKHTVWIAVILASLNGSSTYGVDLILHEHVVPTGPVIRLGDIADISAAASSELDDLVTTLLLPAPAPGTQQYLRTSQIRELLVSRGVDTRDLHFRGASVVKIGEGRKPASTSNVVRLSKSARQRMEIAVRQAIKLYISDQTGHLLWRVEPTLNTAEYRRIAQLGTELTVQGGKKPWSGRQRFQISAATTDAATAVTAQVTKIQRIIVATQPIAQGDLIRAADVELQQFEEAAPTNAFVNLEQVIGMEARRSIQADTVIQKNHVRAPLQVERGETVTVFARTAGIVVRTYAVARQNGALGDLVRVQVLDSKEQFTARVSGRRELEIFATGTNASDYATLRRRETLRR